MSITEAYELQREIAEAHWQSMMNAARLMDEVKHG